MRVILKIVEQQKVHTGKKSVDRVLPTHELRARQRRKQTVPHFSLEPQPQAPEPKAEAHNGADIHVLDNFYSQFPPQTKLR